MSAGPNQLDDLTDTVLNLVRAMDNVVARLDRMERQIEVLSVPPGAEIDPGFWQEGS